MIMTVVAAKEFRTSGFVLFLGSGSLGLGCLGRLGSRGCLVPSSGTNPSAFCF